MTGIQLFAFVVLPLSLVGLGGAAVLLNKWSLDRAERQARR